LTWAILPERKIEAHNFGISLEIEDFMAKVLLRDDSL